MIQPSYGKPETRRHWADTLDVLVPFGESPYRETLMPDQRGELASAHPGGAARFWGATAKHDKRVDVLEPGDVVLLTGQRHVRAIGRVGRVLRNPAFARALWNPDPRDCLWSNVYSLVDYRATWIPYEDIWALPGFTVGDYFMGLRLLDATKSATVLNGLDIDRAP
ncbi:hypothetical protein [Actinokineospora globicatena]|uniref:Uncharacterized protein n=1 Tax=Actinokineospora globicatena TaxID=103729 RepID=A0A9W6QGI2_9PSEU|nr:hypothetical protein [Actinokineospora globicatena]GLW89666.1 hypothetical protein Aglo03_04820 [Actinokineospora globicatena]